MSWIPPLGEEEVSILTENLPSVWWGVCLGSESSCYKGNRVIFIKHFSL